MQSHARISTDNTAKIAASMVDKTLAEHVTDAANYANTIIKKSYTHLDCNGLENDRYRAIFSGVWDLRNVWNAESTGRTFEWAFRRNIELIEKYSLGNCEEFAWLAASYFAKLKMNISIEIFYIGNGDHAFAVFGRDQNSIEENPETWGDNCYICDPWSNLIYRASEYKDKLKNFYQVLELNSYSQPPQHLTKNCLQPLQAHHKITKKFAINYATIDAPVKADVDKNQDLYENLGSIIGFLSQYYTRLFRIAETLKTAGGDNCKKYKIVLDKLEVITKASERLMFVKLNYESMKDKPAHFLEKTLKKERLFYKRNYQSLLLFNDNELKELKALQPKNKVMGFFSQLFGYQDSSFKEISKLEQRLRR